MSTIFFFIHDIDMFHFDAKAVEQGQGCVAIFIFVADKKQEYFKIWGAIASKSKQPWSKKVLLF